MKRKEIYLRASVGCLEGVVDGDFDGLDDGSLVGALVATDREGRNIYVRFVNRTQEIQ